MVNFYYSRFYRWTRPVTWIIWVIVCNVSGWEFHTTFIGLLVAIVYAGVFPIIAKGIEQRPVRSEVEKFKADITEYLRTLFEDIAHINNDEGLYGFDFIRFTLPDSHAGASAELFLNDDYSFSIQIFKKLFDEDPDNEIMKGNYRDTLCYEKGGYIAKNTRFRDELLSKSIGEFETPAWHDDDRPFFSISLYSFANIMNFGWQSYYAESIICTLANEKHFKVSFNRRRDRERMIGIIFN